MREKIQEKLKKREAYLRKLKPIFIHPNQNKPLLRLQEEGDWREFVRYFASRTICTVWENGKYNYQGHRSIPDIYRVTISYFPDVALEDVVEYLVNCKVNCWYCAYPERIVFGNEGNALASNNIYSDATGLNIGLQTLRLAYANGPTYIYGSRWTVKNLKYERSKWKKSSRI